MAEVDFVGRGRSGFFKAREMGGFFAAFFFAANDVGGIKSGVWCMITEQGIDADVVV